MQRIWATAAALSPAAAPTFADVAGWTKTVSSQFTLVGTVLNIRVHCFTKKATSADSNVTLNAGTNCAMGFVRSSYSNPDPNGFFGQVTFGEGGPGTSATVTGITAARTNSLLDAFLSQGAAQSATPPSGMTERVDNTTYGASQADVIQALSGATGNKVFTLPSSADYIWGFAEWYSNNVVTVDESITLSDSQDAVAEFVGLSDESITFADSQAAIAEFISAQAETITLSDSQVAGSNSEAAQDETLTLSDAQVASLGVDAAQDETLTLSDAQVAAGGTDALQDESITLVDSAVATQASASAQAETITLSDSAVAIAAFDGAQDESITLVDEQDATEPSDSAQDETITFLDSQIAVQDSACAQGESITFVDVVATQGDEPAEPFGGGFFTQALRRRLFEEEMREKLKELPEQVADVIENTVIDSIDRPKRPTQKQLRQVFERENIPYREAYRQAVISLVQDMRQMEEDEEEEEALALVALF